MECIMREIRWSVKMRALVFIQLLLPGVRGQGIFSYVPQTSCVNGLLNGVDSFSIGGIVRNSAPIYVDISIKHANDLSYTLICLIHLRVHCLSNPWKRTLGCYCRDRGPSGYEVSLRLRADMRLSRATVSVTWRTSTTIGIPEIYNISLFEGKCTYRNRILTYCCKAPETCLASIQFKGQNHSHQGCVNIEVPSDLSGQQNISVFYTVCHRNFHDFCVFTVSVDENSALKKISPENPGECYRFPCVRHFIGIGVGVIGGIIIIFVIGSTIWDCKHTEGLNTGAV